MRTPLTDEQYAQSLAVCDATGKATYYTHNKTGERVCVVDIRRSQYYPSIGLRSTGLRPRYFEIRALNFKKTYAIEAPDHE